MCVSVTRGWIRGSVDHMSMNSSAEILDLIRAGWVSGGGAGVAPCMSYCLRTSASSPALPHLSPHLSPQGCRYRPTLTWIFCCFIFHFLNENLMCVWIKNNCSLFQRWHPSVLSGFLELNFHFESLTTPFNNKKRKIVTPHRCVCTFKQTRASIFPLSACCIRQLF